MKTTIALLLLSLCQISYAYDYKELNAYEKPANELFALFQSTDFDQKLDKDLAHSLIGDLINKGVDIMKVFAHKYPECALQYDVIYSEIASMADLSFDEVHSKYHDGKGLPTASKLCYLGRSQVVHPVLTQILLRSEWNLEIKEEVLHEVEEVIEHLALIERYLNK